MNAQELNKMSAITRNQNTVEIISKVEIAAEKAAKLGKTYVSVDNPVPINIDEFKTHFKNGGFSNVQVYDNFVYVSWGGA